YAAVRAQARSAAAAAAAAEAAASSPAIAAASSSPAAAASSSSGAAAPVQASPFKSSLHEDKATFLLQNPDILRAYTRTMLPIFLQTASSSSDLHLRYKCVSGLLRLCCV